MVTIERNQSHEKVVINVPEAAENYTTEGMGSVDHLNQVIRSHDWNHKNYSWRSCHFQTLFRFALVNSWIIWKIHHGVVPFNEFLLTIQYEFKEKYILGKEERKRKITEEKLKRKMERQKKIREEKRRKLNNTNI